MKRGTGGQRGRERPWLIGTDCVALAHCCGPLLSESWGRNLVRWAALAVRIAGRFRDMAVPALSCFSRPPSAVQRASPIVDMSIRMFWFPSADMSSASRGVMVSCRLFCNATSSSEECSKTPSCTKLQCGVASGPGYEDPNSRSRGQGAAPPRVSSRMAKAQMTGRFGSSSGEGGKAANPLRLPVVPPKWQAPGCWGSR